MGCVFCGDGAVWVNVYPRWVVPRNVLASGCMSDTWSTAFVGAPLRTDVCMFWHMT
jgi:hypothetical protein